VPAAERVSYVMETMHTDKLYIMNYSGSLAELQKEKTAVNIPKVLEIYAIFWGKIC